MCLESRLLADWYLVKDKDSQTQLASQKIVKKCEVSTGSFFFYPITQMPFDFCYVVVLITSWHRGKEPIYEKYTREVVKIFVFLTDHFALANILLHLQGC